MTAALILAIGVALAFAALCGYLVLELDARTLQCRFLASRSKQLGQIARDREAECARLSEIIRESEAAYAQLQESVAVGGWVRLPSNEELHEGVWP